MNKRQPKLRLFFDRDKVYPWPWNVADEVLTRDIADIADGKKMSVILEEYDRGHIFMYCSLEEMNALARHLLDKLLRQRTFFDATIKNVYSGVDDFLKRWQEKTQGNMQSEADGGLLNLLAAYVAGLKKVRVWGWVPALVDGADEPFLTNACIAALKTDFPEKDESEINAVFSLLSSPRAFGEVQKSEIEKWQLVTTIGEKNLQTFLSSTDDTFAELDVETKKRIEGYIERFTWIAYNYAGPALTIASFRESIQGLTVAKATKELDNILAKQRETFAAQDNFLEQNRLSEKTRYVLEIVRAFIILKEYRKSVYQQSYILADKILAEIARRLGMALDVVKFLSLEEIRSAFGNKDTYAEKAARRQGGYMAVIVEDGQSVFLDGEEAQTQAEMLKEKVSQMTVKELTGQVAYPGKVSGTAKIIRTVDDLSKMQMGDILISSSTNPDLLPAMKKAGAIVTEMGGIICHAAIVARELHIPCVVGTKIALKVIKDGDHLDVDAAKGIVHIL